MRVGRAVKASWSQIAWGIATLATILGAWFDMRNQLALTRQAFELRVILDDKEHDHLWQAIKEVQAAQAAPKKGK